MRYCYKYGMSERVLPWRHRFQRRVTRIPVRAPKSLWATLRIRSARLESEMRGLLRNRALKQAQSGTVATEAMKLSVAKRRRMEIETDFVRRGRLSFDPRKLGTGRKANQSECRTPHKQVTTHGRGLSRGFTGQRNCFICFAFG